MSKQLGNNNNNFYWNVVEYDNKIKKKKRNVIGIYDTVTYGTGENNLY